MVMNENKATNENENKEENHQVAAVTQVNPVPQEFEAIEEAEVDQERSNIASALKPNSKKRTLTDFEQTQDQPSAANLKKFKGPEEIPQGTTVITRGRRMNIEEHTFRTMTSEER